MTVSSSCVLSPYMNDVNANTAQPSAWEQLQEAQEWKVVGLARQLLTGQGSDLYRRTLVTFLNKEPRGLHRLELSEQNELSQILKREKLRESN